MKVSFSISLDEKLIEQLKEYAAKNRSSVSNVADNAIWSFLNPAPTVIRNSEKPKKYPAKARF